MMRLSEATERTVRLGGLHLIPAGVGTVMILWIAWGDPPGLLRSMLAGWIALIALGAYRFGLADGVARARDGVSDREATEHSRSHVAPASSDESP